MSTLETILAQHLAEESFRHTWDTSDERKIDDEWVWGLCCECGEFVPYGEEVTHIAAAFTQLLNAPNARAAITAALTNQGDL